MSFHFLAGPAAESSAASYAVTLASALLKSKSIRGKCSLPDSVMESCPSSPSGTTSEPSGQTTPNALNTSSCSEASRMSLSSPVGSLAKIFPAPVEAPDWTANGQVSGGKCTGSLAKYDPESRSWKTRQRLLFGVDFELLDRLPNWGMTVDGELYRLKTPVLRTDEGESGLWRSPDTGAGGTSGLLKEGKDFRENGQPIQVRLIDQVANKRLWPTPNARDHKDTPGMSLEGVNPDGSKRKRDDQLARRVYGGGTSTRRTYPPPTSSMMTAADMEQARFAGGDPKRPTYQEAKRETTGLLNPEWVEWLMGWPIGYTDLKPLAMDRFLRWLRLHGIYYEVTNERS